MRALGFGIFVFLLSVPSHALKDSYKSCYAKLSPQTRDLLSGWFHRGEILIDLRSFFYNQGQERTVHLLKRLGELEAEVALLSQREASDNEIGMRITVFSGVIQKVNSKFLTGDFIAYAPTNHEQEELARRRVEITDISHIRITPKIRNLLMLD